MGKLYFFLFCTVVLASCGRKYKVEGVSSVSSLDGKMLFIKVSSGDKLVVIDSAEVVHGLFSMKGKVDSTVIASLYMDDDCLMPLVIEKGDIDIHIDNSGITIKGTPLNDRFNKFIMEKNSLDDRAYEVERLESRMIMDGRDPKLIQIEIGQKRAALGEDMENLAKKFIQDNYDNVLGPGVFIMMCNGFPYPVLTPVMKNIVDQAPESFKNNPMIKEYISEARHHTDKYHLVH